MDDMESDVTLVRDQGEVEEEVALSVARLLPSYSPKMRTR